jgi:integrase
MPTYGYNITYLEPKALAEAGLAHLADQPFIFDSGPGYARLPNQFLIDRALGLWDPRGRGKSRNPIPPSRISMRNYARGLCNALEWAEARGVELITADYSAVLIGRYQQEMLKGIWSAGNRPLQANTVNSRVQVALEFQTWAADKGLRDPFHVPTVTRTYVSGSHKYSRSHEANSVDARLGKVKVNKRILSFPSISEIEEWRQRVLERPIVGATHALIVDLILNTAIRREEAACWRVDTLPLDPKDWRVVNSEQPEEYQSVVVTVKYGTKGHQYAVDEHGDKIGPEGTIHVPLWLARSLHAYRNRERLVALKRKVMTGKTVAAQRQLQKGAVHLFLHPQTGERYSGDQIYNFWSRVKGPPHWSPHLGRDWWACRYLEERMKQHAELTQNVLGSPNISSEHPMVLALRDTTQTVIQMEIRPQLRHASASTTEIYLEWLFAKMRVPLTMTRQWVELDEGQNGCEEVRR